ncbi:hypothetical protein AYY16_17045 [Morganella psychrotolerans]|uniref:hypothetical protein n=1 Tax=Morganella psychrotolerans TaxID=368603 RepID=UPI0007FFC2A8|nr:hypothetical protein [Morganella psychrotolerans]OBU01914.1 hypothetical protein AYY16_17045 [Morganella psychrotolerans]
MIKPLFFLTDKEKALENIKYYLSKLSMVRVVKTKADERSELKTGYLNTWPLFYDTVYIDAVEYAKSKGALQERDFFVKTFSVNRHDYDDFASRKEPSNKANKLKNKISLLRSYIEILRVVEKTKFDGENISLTIGYDTEKTPTDLLPTNTENLDKIINIKNSSDIFYGFSTDSGWKAKLKGRDGCFFIS